MIEKAIAILQNAGFDLTAREIAEILWLSVYINPTTRKVQSPAHSSLSIPPSSSLNPSLETGAFHFGTLALLRGSKTLALSLLWLMILRKGDAPPETPSVSITLPPLGPPQVPTSPQPSGGIPIKVPAPPALRDSLALTKALRPLKRKVPSYTEVVIDEVATATRIAETKIRLPVFKPASKRWLDLAFVVESNSTTTIWKQTLIEFQHLLQHQGAFRDIRLWGLKEIEGKIQLLAQTQAGEFTNSTHSPKELIDARGQRLIILVSDCISPLWRKGTIHPILELWGKQGLLTLLELLPSSLWERTALASQVSGQMRNLFFDRQLRNYKLTIEVSTDEDEIPSNFRKEDELTSNFRKTIPVPVVTLDPNSLSTWAKVLVGVGKNETVSYYFTAVDHRGDQSQSQSTAHSPLSPTQLVNRFRATASPLARRLAGLMAIAPVHISVIHLIQQTLLTESSQLHVAEVFMSGLLKSFPSNKNPNLIEYDFVEGIREILRQSISASDSILVIEKVSEYIAKRYGFSLRSFEALLLENNNILDAQTANSILPFARLKAQVLREWGGAFARVAEQLESQANKQEWLQGLNLQSFSVKVATILFEDNGHEKIIENPEGLKLEFETVFVNNRGEIIETLPYSAYYYKESLDIKNRNEDGLKSFVGNDNIKSEVDNNDWGSEHTQTVEPLTMIYIPEGEFIMGSHSDEKDRYDDEGPQHRVKIAPFYMSQTPITQAQWRAIANEPQVERELKPNPSEYEGDENPVDNIDWYDAIEYCARLSIYTGREYRLPSEAEWEYACRGFETPPVIISDGEDTEGENTINTKVYPPFHFGETITDKLANYYASETYADEPKGEYRSKTTPVRTFKPNAFGLYDMHGNVYEWCLDPWHSDYNGAPTDGRVWDEENQQEDYYQDIVKNIKKLLTDERSHVIRGGSCLNSPRLCRSADRYSNYARYSDDGLRVVCGLPRTGNQ